jgi:hypothetical protein
MKNFRFYSLRVVAIGFLLSVTSFAQQSTPYSTPNFSATFNNTVTTDNSSQTSSVSYIYKSVTQSVGQMVTVRIVDHDIAVSHESSNFYANDDRTGGTMSDVKQDYYQGHPFTYSCHTYDFKGTSLTKRARVIIVNARTVIFIEQISAAAYNDTAEWTAFEDSLVIK